MFCDNWLNGVGISQFQIKYGLYQASYFASGTYSQKEMFLADNTYFAFNDYWQWIVETGLVGILGLVIALPLVFKIAKRAISRSSGNITATFALSVLLTLCVAALFTHVFEKAIYYSTATACLLLLSLISINGRIQTRNVFFTIIVVYSVAMLAHSFNQFIFYKSYAKFETAKKLVSIGNINDGLHLYRSIFPELKDDIVFLETYCDELIVNGEEKYTLEILKETVAKRTSNKLYAKLGDQYTRMGMLKEAEKSYITCVNMVPNRFSSRLRLLDFYIKNNREYEAKRTALSILRMPIKVYSPQVAIAKTKALEFLK